MPFESLLRARLLAKVAAHPLNLMDKAVVVEKLSLLYDPRSIEEQFFPLLEVPRKPEMHHLLLTLARSPDEVRQALWEGYISDQAAYMIASWDEHARIAVVRLFRSLRCSASLQREFLEYIADLCRVNDCTPWSFLETSPVRLVVEDDTRSPREKTEALRSLLRETLFPRLTAREKEVRERIRTLALPREIEIRPPAFFEGDEWVATIRFANIAELSRRLEMLQEKATLLPVSATLTDKDRP